MAIGYCKYHKSNDVREHVFQFDDRDDFCECPVCHKRMKKSEAIKAFDDKINHYIYWGRFHLFVTANYKKAYNCFATSLDLDPLNVKGYTGRINALFLMSTLRNPRIGDTKEMVEQAFALLAKDKDNHDAILSSLLFLNKHIEKYIKTIRKKLIHRIYFHDKECVKLYLERIAETKNLREVFLKEINTLIKRQSDDVQYYEEVKKTIIASKEKDELDLTIYQPCLDGYSYKAVFLKDGSLVLQDDGFKQSVNLSAYHPFSIKKERGKYQINDIVFHSFSNTYNLYIFSLLICILTFVIGACCLIGMFIFIDYKTLLFLLGTLLLCGSLAMLITRLVLFLYFRKRLKKNLG